MYLASRIAQSEFERIAKRVKGKIRALPRSCRHERADAGLKNIWEEFKYQFQGVNSGYTDFYEGVVRDLCTAAIARLPPGFQQLLWLCTDEFSNLWVEQDEVTLDDCYRSSIVDALYRTVCDLASNEQLEFNPDDEESRINYELDRSISWGEHEVESKSGTSLPMTWTYYEYADDLLGRKNEDNTAMLPESWNGSEWETVYDSVRWMHTAQKIEDVEGFKARNPQLMKAFDAQ